MKSEILSDPKFWLDLSPPDSVRSGHAMLMSAVKMRSEMVWGEHCSECAYPSCYATCAFYTPRNDFHCRRFEAGFEPLAEISDFKRIRFRQWGKVEAEGPVRPVSVSASERGPWDKLMDGLNHLKILPGIVRRKLAFLRHKKTLAQSQRPAPGLDALVIEAYCADGRNHELTISLFNTGPEAAHGAQQLFQAHFSVTQAYGRLVVPINEIQARIDLNQPWLIQIEPLNEAAGRAVIFGLCDFVGWHALPLPSVQPVMRGKSRAGGSKAAALAKLIVWDLDETLWHGILAEDGIEGLSLRPEAVAAIKALDERGILHAIASKNDADLALKALDHFGLKDYFLCPQISWGPKSQAVATIAQTLSLGLDSFIFIDDQPFERAEVGAMHTEVRILTHEDIAGLIDMDCFNVPVSEESRKRRALYREEASRQAGLTASGGDYRAFLKASGMQLTLQPLSVHNRVRVQELSQRTNQLNFTGTKYSLPEVDALMSSPEIKVALRCADAYGDYGLIGFVVFDLNTGQVSRFFMSCRVQKKRVEQAFFEWLRHRMRTHGVHEMRLDHVPTARNGAARTMMAELGFHNTEDGYWSRSLETGFEGSDLVKLIEDMESQTLSAVS